MADDKKSVPSSPELIDDWDSLPLEPGDDDWDDIPPPKIDSAPEPDSTHPTFSAPIPPTAAPPSFPDSPGAVPPPDSGRIFALLGAEETPETEDGFVPPFPADGPDLEPGISRPPDREAAAKPEAGAALKEAGPPVEPDDLDPEPDLADHFPDAGPFPPAQGLVSPPAASKSTASQLRAEPSEPDDFNAHLEALVLDEGFETAAGKGREPSQTSIMEKIEAELEDLPTKKVELDIDGIFLEDQDAPPPPEEEAPPEPEPVVEPEAEPAVDVPPPTVPQEAPPRKKIPRIKLLMVLVTALLLVFGLGFGLYELFFSSPAAEDDPALLAIDPNVPPREPVPGTLDLGPFYVNFPGERGETIMEMTVTLHYRDLPDRAAIEARLPLTRDIIYLAAQGQGSQIISNGETQRLFRSLAAEQANAALGGDHIDYVQITQIRILQ